jgi:putative MATE family efflux protein
MRKRNEAEFREYALHGNLWGVLFTTGLPLSVFALFNGFFQLLDTLMASHVGTIAVSAIAYISQLEQILNAIGAGLIGGGMVLICRAYGLGDKELTRRRIGNLMRMLLLLGFILLCCIPFAKPILRLLGTPDDFITAGTEYFQVIMVVVVLNFITTLYLSIEKTRGNTQRIMFLNLMTIVIKLGLSALFIYRMDGKIVMVAVATACSYTVLATIGLITLSRPGSLFSFNKRYFHITKSISVPMISISYPLAIEKASFALGKTMVNGMVATYGTTTVGALGISNNLSGVVTNLQNGFSDSAGSIISQNIGAGLWDRAKAAHRITVAIMLVVSVFGVVILSLFAKPMIHLFATNRSGSDFLFEQTIWSIFSLDVISVVPLALNSANVSFILGLGKTKIELLIAFCRIFLFRIPVLYAIKNFTTLGTHGIGWMMLISNGLTALLSSILVAVIIRRHDATSLV